MEILGPTQYVGGRAVQSRHAFTQLMQRLGYGVGRLMKIKKVILAVAGASRWSCGTAKKARRLSANSKGCGDIIPKLLEFVALVFCAELMVSSYGGPWIRLI